MGTASALKAPFLRSVELRPERIEAAQFPFTLPLFARGAFRLDFERPITFLVGENGAGKSTVMEAIAAHSGFRPEGGSSDHGTVGGLSQTRPHTAQALARALRFAWKPKVTRGFFFRAETFFGLAHAIDAVNREWGAPPTSGERDIDRMSHGEGFFALFNHRFGAHSNVLYLMDEPEAALSPSRQMAFIALLHRWHRSRRVQAIIATHAPILMAYPNATILSLDGEVVRPVAFRETDHYRQFKSFLDAPERYLATLLQDAESAERDGQEELLLE